MTVIQLNAVKCAVCEHAERVYEWFSEHPTFNLRWAVVDVAVIVFAVCMWKS